MTDVTDPDGNPTVNYEAGTVPSDKVVESVEYQTGELTVVIHGEVDGGPNGFTPVVTITGSNVSSSPVSCSLSVIGTDTRRYQFSQAITLTGEGVVTIATQDGGGHRVAFTEAEAPPTITTLVHGSPPGEQTRVKNGDTVSFDATFPAGASTFVLEAFHLNGVTPQEYPIDPTDTSISDTFTVAGADGNPHWIKAHLKMASGAPGPSKDSTSATLWHDSTVPQIASVTVDNYPGAQTALKDAESCNCTAVVTDYTQVNYTDNGTGELSIPLPMVYAETKTVARAGGDYRETGSNYKIVATKASNDTSSTEYATVRIAHVAPVVTVGRNSGGSALYRMGTDDGTLGQKDCYVYLVSDQVIQPDETPVLYNGGGGGWVGGGFSYYNSTSYRRYYRVEDVDIVQGGQAANNYTWNGCSVKNRALKEATTVTTNPNYSLGGFEARTLTIPAWPNREADCSVFAVDTSKLASENLSKGGEGPNGGTIFTFDNSPGEGNTPDDEVDKFCMTNGSDIVDDDGAYWYNKDETNAISNISGTAQVIVEEAA
jgi:hypothetical protein